MITLSGVIRSWLFGPLTEMQSETNNLIRQAELRLLMKLNEMEKKMAKNQQDVIDEVTKLATEFQSLGTAVQDLIQELKDARANGQDETPIVDKLVGLEQPVQSLIDAANAVITPSADAGTTPAADAGTTTPPAA